MAQAAIYFSNQPQEIEMTQAAYVAEKFATMSEQERHAFFVAISRESTFPQAVRTTAAEAAVELTKLRFSQRRDEAFAK
jgi:hypothetical protein